MSDIFISYKREDRPRARAVARSFEKHGFSVWWDRKIPPGRTFDQVIQEALDRGEFDDLPGRGKPIQIEDDSGVPEDLRLAYKVLKNADCLPPELQLKKEIRQMEELLENIPDEKEKYRQIKKINYKIMKLNLMGKKSPLLEEREIYYKKLVEKFGEAGAKERIEHLSGAIASKGYRYKNHYATILTWERMDTKRGVGSHGTHRRGDTRPPGKIPKHYTDPRELRHG